MKLGFFTSFALLTAAALTVSAQPKSELRPDETVLLYAEEFTDQTDPVRAEKIIPAGFEMAESNGITEGEFIKPSGALYNIGEDARFDLYFPAKPNGQMVVVCPGGGMNYVSSYNEGVYVAEWMLERGITVAVLKYRLPNLHHSVPLQDVQNTFRYCRAHESEWGVNQIGVMGFSAGGYLAVMASVLYDDAVTRPDFSVFIYALVSFDTSINPNSSSHINMIGTREEANRRDGKSWEEWEEGKNLYDKLERKYCLENQTSPDCPPAFIALCSDDTSVVPENSIRLYSALTANKVPVEMHIYPHCGHGWGFASEKYAGAGKDKFAYAREEFYNSLDRWLRGIME